MKRLTGEQIKLLHKMLIEEQAGAMACGMKICLNLQSILRSKLLTAYMFIPRLNVRRRGSDTL